jgi:hypothetical protein
MSSKLGTGAQWFNLSTGSNDNPTLIQGKATTFNCNTLPDRCATGPLAYDLDYVLLTITGQVVQPATSGSAVPFDVLKGCLIGSVDWLTSWFGTVLSANHFMGSNLPVVEYVTSGYGYTVLQRPPIPAAAGTYVFELSVALPAANLRTHLLGGMTSQLALLFQTSTIKLNVAGASVLDSVSTGATFTNLAARMSARLIPTATLKLGTPMENIQHQLVGSTNSPQIQIKGFGTDTLMQGTFEKGGVAFLGELTSKNLQSGIFTANQITQYAFDWRGQAPNYHPQTQVADLLAAMGQRRELAQPVNVAGGDANFASFPYANNTSDQVTTGQTLMDLTGLLFWPMAFPGANLALSDLQTADSDKSYFLTAGTGGGFASGSHLVQALYARQWLPQTVNKWVSLITKGGSGSLAAYVINGNGGDYTKAQPLQLQPHGKNVVTPDQRTYLPYIFA